MSNNIQRITVKAIIEKNNQILLLNDLKGKWELPGGKIEFGEDPTEALKRELKEELGIVNAVIDGVVDIWSFTVSDKGIDYQFIVVVYKVSTDDTIQSIIEEYHEMKWMNLGELLDINMREGYKLAISKFFSSL